MYPFKIMVARGLLLLLIGGIAQPAWAECQPDTKYLGTWNWLHLGPPASANWASCQNLPTSSMSACWTPFMISGFCGSGYKCKANSLYCAQDYQGQCIRIGQNVSAFRDFQTDGVKGHIFYSVVGAFSATTYLGDGFWGNAIDFVNPLSLGKDALDIYDEFSESEAEACECESK